MKSIVLILMMKTNSFDSNSELETDQDSIDENQTTDSERKSDKNSSQESSNN